METPLCEFVVWPSAEPVARGGPVARLCAGMWREPPPWARETALWSGWSVRGAHAALGVGGHAVVGLALALARLGQHLGVGVRDFLPAVGAPSGGVRTEAHTDELQ